MKIDQIFENFADIALMKWADRMTQAHVLEIVFLADFKNFPALDIGAAHTKNKKCQP